MAIDCKQQKNEEDITKKVTIKIEQNHSSDHAILIYMKDDVGDTIGFFSKGGFRHMLGTKKKYRLVSIITLGDSVFPTWFKVFKKKEKEDG